MNETFTKRKIEQLQRYLRFIANEDDRIPKVAPDGIFGQRTHDAVKAFQEINGLPATGEVDEKTWDEIYKQYQEIYNKSRPVNKVDLFTYSEPKLKSGEENTAIYFIQTMIKYLSNIFSNIDEPEINGKMDEKTEHEIEKLKEICDCNGNDDDKSFLELLSKIFETAVYFAHENK
ncbi:MAG: peptidoglycan-binding protein [Clostridia bacterium]|nr:peptidoglycan-binding protein [Clostridia bacterium]